MRQARVLAGAALAAALAAPPAAAGGGTLDPTFGPGGTVLTDVGGQGMAYGVVVQPDGKVVAAGYVNHDGNYDFALARLQPDGGPDLSFGTKGLVVTDIGGAGSYDVGRAVALQGDGSIVVAGSSNARGSAQFALARYTADGTLDRAFGTDGIALTDVTAAGRYAAAYAVAIEPDGAIVAAGSADNGKTTDFALARYTGAGLLDAGFGADGTTMTDLGGQDYGYGLAIQPDGGAVVAGASDASGTMDVALARYDNGRLDPTFGVGGTVRTDVSGGYDDARAVAIQPDGAIVAAGSSTTAGHTDFALARYTTDGALDGRFGTGGLVRTALGGGYDVALAVVVQPDSKIVAAGCAGGVRRADFAVARYDDRGQPDPTFGGTGAVVTDVSGRHRDNQAFAVALRPDGRIVAAGSADVSPAVDFAFAQYQP